MDNSDGIKLSLRIPPDPTDEDLQYVCQLGINHVYTWQKEEKIDLNYLKNLRRKVESFGITLYNLGAAELGKNDKIHLALAGRDEAIERFSQFIRNLGDAGISTTTFTWEPAGARSSRISCSASC